MDLIPVDAQHLRLRHRGEEVTLQLVRTTRKLHPSAVVRPSEGASLLVAPAASNAAAERARAMGWSLATDNGPIWIQFSNEHVLELSGPPVPPPRRPARPGRTPWGTLALVRRLLLAAPAPQTRLAALAGVSQARVSQVFDRLQRERLVRHTRNGWEPTDWDALCDWWLDNYPGPGGVTTWWSSLEPPRAQALATVRTVGHATTPVVSGDVGADLIAPWRQPALAIVYAHRGVDLAASLAPLPSAEGATLALVVPEDRSLWPPQPITRTSDGTQLAVADGLQILYDLHRSPGTDAPEAAARWRAYLNDQYQKTVDTR